MLNEQIARVCHNVNRAYCESMGDSSQPSWEDAPEWQRKSAINGVQFHVDNPNALPGDSHEEWLEEMEADGWGYGTEKNLDTKEHPCFIPYYKLPVEECSKDFIFTAIVRELKGNLNKKENCMVEKGGYSAKKEVTESMFEMLLANINAKTQQIKECEETLDLFVNRMWGCFIKGVEKENSPVVDKSGFIGQLEVSLERLQEGVNDLKTVIAQATRESY